MTRLIDNGPDLVLIYPEVEIRDEYGTPIRVAGDTAFEVRTQLQRLTASEAAALGQESTTVVQFRTGRDLPAGPWARVEAWGRTWRVDGEPVTQGRTHRTRNTLVTMTTGAPPLPAPPPTEET